MEKEGRARLTHRAVAENQGGDLQAEERTQAGGLGTTEGQVFPGGSASNDSSCNAGDLGLIPALGRYPREGNGYPLQYSGLENSMDCIVHGVTKSWMQLSEDVKWE